MTTAYYAYTPSAIPAIIGVGIYCTLAAVHSLRVISTKAWDGSFMIFGSFFQAMGCGARILSSHNKYEKGAWAAQYVLLIWGPALVMFTVNLTSVEFTKAIGAEKKVLIKPRIARPLYFTINTILFLLLSIGVVMKVTAATEKLQMGTTLTKAGLIIQLLFWLFTFIENLVMTIRLGRDPSKESLEVVPQWKRWNQLLGLATSIIAMGHNVVQLTQMGMASDGFMNATEWPAYAFDIYQLAVVLGAWGIWYLPGRCQAVVPKRKGNWGLMASEYQLTESRNVDYPDTRYGA
ncbi:hypothetical protein BO94DRAFT_584422 [Aspergillus sclerotioniger CBS 115572]|uniref:RTA1 domain protein n=1 Tax=Aspergillus sclerotioniger CBS 115572 TaxID=1450535 RepID=A0A317WWY3_9EURO|nr:hypothetical protein BO94DRAFT_584422 [Aspergillus sclerotioniger CBS 115572]PWY90411.1 hypothetical protein BO94DRAFT_584422 [Aspergillus sclerotioniger CBS 115572]